MPLKYITYLMVFVQKLRYTHSNTNTRSTPPIMTGGFDFTPDEHPTVTHTPVFNSVPTVRPLIHLNSIKSDRSKYANSNYVPRRQPVPSPQKRPSRQRAYATPSIRNK